MSYLLKLTWSCLLMAWNFYSTSGQDFDE